MENKHCEAVEALWEPEPLGFTFDPEKELTELRERLGEEVEGQFMTVAEANEIFNLAKEQYGL